jgi:histidyl-tRNA synthetase
VLLAADAEGALLSPGGGVDVFVVDLVGGAAARDLAERLRRSGIATDRAFDGRSLKAQLRVADRSHARLAAIVGAAELGAGDVTLRVLRGEGAGSQETVETAALEGAIQRWIT